MLLFNSKYEYLSKVLSPSQFRKYNEYKNSIYNEVVEDKYHNLFMRFSILYSICLTCGILLLLKKSK